MYASANENVHYRQVENLIIMGMCTKYEQNN
jgi:hypothetical protein